MPAPRPSLAAPDTTTITFDEFPIGTVITNQYRDRGVIFEGDSPGDTQFITGDSSNPTSPVLSGTPLFFGSVGGRFVVPSTNTPDTVDSFTLDVGYIDNPGSVAVSAYNASGALLTRQVANQVGIDTLTISASGISRFRVEAVGNEPAGFAVDNLNFALGDIHFKGSVPVPVNFGGEEDTGSPQQAKACRSISGKLELAEDRIILAAAGVFYFSTTTHGREVFNHFMSGLDTSVDYPDSSARTSVSGEVKASPEFKKLNDKVQNEVVNDVRAGQTDIHLILSPRDDPDFLSNRDLEETFRGTQGLDITGSVHNDGIRIMGTVTYVIRDVYGFGTDAFKKFGPAGSAARYLQTVCGAPDYPNGAHWFPDSVTVTVSFDQPA